MWHSFHYKFNGTTDTKLWLHISNEFTRVAKPESLLIWNQPNITQFWPVCVSYMGGFPSLQQDTCVL